MEDTILEHQKNPSAKRHKNDSSSSTSTDRVQDNPMEEDAPMKDIILESQIYPSAKRHKDDIRSSSSSCTDVVPKVASRDKSDDSVFAGLKVPPVVKTRGRPKGNTMTTIGLPSRKTKNTKKLQCFLDLHTTEKEKIILSWFVNDEVIHTTMNSDKLVEETEVESRPEKVPSSVLDENVEVSLVRHYFTNDAWLLVEDVVERKRLMDVWLCNSCNKDLNIDESIVCEHCLLWYHFSCIAFSKMPKKKKWFCRSCHSAK